MPIHRIIPLLQRDAARLIKRWKKSSSRFSIVWSWKHSVGVVIVLTLLACQLRMSNLDRLTWGLIGGDESRDMLVAKHMVKHGEWLFQGPRADGNQGSLANSPLYYYLIAAVWAISGDPVRFMYVWAGISSLLVVVAFIAGKVLKDDQTGLILAALVAVNHKYISGAREVFQPHLLAIFAFTFIISIGLLLRDRRQTWAALFAVFSLLLSLHFHFAGLLAFPIGFIWIGGLLLMNLIDYKQKLPVLLVIVGVVSVVVSWAVFVLPTLTAQQTLVLGKGEYAEQVLTVPFRFRWLSLHWLLYYIVVGVRYSVIEVAVWVGVVLGFIVTQARRLRTFVIEPGLLFVVSMSFSAYFTLLYLKVLRETYLLFLVPFILAAFAYLLRWLWVRSIVGKFLVLVAIGAVWQNSITKLSVFIPGDSVYVQTRDVTATIINDWQTTYGMNAVFNGLVVWRSTAKPVHSDGWAASGVWYWLEEMSGQLLVQNVPGSALSYLPIASRPQILYLVCDRRFYPEGVAEGCVQYLKSNYPIDPNSLKMLSEHEYLSLFSAVILPDAQDVKSLIYKPYGVQPVYDDEFDDRPFWY